MPGFNYYSVWISKGINISSIVLISTDMDTRIFSIIDNFLDNVSSQELYVLISKAMLLFCFMDIRSNIAAKWWTSLSRLFAVACHNMFDTSSCYNASMFRYVMTSAKLFIIYHGFCSHLSSQMSRSICGLYT